MLEPVIEPTALRTNLRLDPGHHPSRSRWPTHDAANRRPRLAAEPAPRCVAIVATREARLLAAMVNWISAGESAAVDPHGESRCLASVGGRCATDPAGMVEFWPTVVPAGGYLLTHGEFGLDDPGQPRLATVEQYSLVPGGGWWAGDLKATAGRYRFRAFLGELYRAEVRLQVYGVDHVLPALAALAIGLRMSLTPRQVTDRLAEFSGVARGFESRGSFRGATLLDDEAAGPGAVAAALGLARDVFGRRTIRAVYLPHDPSSRVGVPSASEFAAADHLILVNPPATRTESTRLLGASLRSSGASVLICSSLDRATRELDRVLEPGDVLMTLGAGEVGTIADAFLRRLQRDRHG